MRTLISGLSLHCLFHFLFVFSACSSGAELHKVHRKTVFGLPQGNSKGAEKPESWKTDSRREAQVFLLYIQPAAGKRKAAKRNKAISTCRSGAEGQERVQEVPDRPKIKLTMVIVDCVWLVLVGPREKSNGSF